MVIVVAGEWVNNTSRVDGLVRSLVRSNISVQLRFVPDRREYAGLSLGSVTIAEQEDFQVGSSAPTHPPKCFPWLIDVDRAHTVPHARPPTQAPSLPT